MDSRVPQSHDVSSRGASPTGGLPTGGSLPRRASPLAVTRREMLQRSGVGFGYLALSGLLAEQALADESSTASSAVAGAQVAVAQVAASAPPRSDRNPLAPRQPHFEPRAKRVIFLFMKGGPSHLDTFDYKPKLQEQDGKPLPFDKPRVQFAPTGALLKSPWKFKQHGENGIPVSQLFPHVARHVDDICFIHSVHGTNAAHGGALLKLHTGSDNFVRPSMGAWVTYGLGTENQNLPGFVTICPTLAHGGVKNWGSAFLPAYYQGTPLGNASLPSTQANVGYIHNKRLSTRLQKVQLEMLEEFNRRHLESAGGEDALEARIRSFELAFRMQAEMPQIENLADESPATLRMYGLENDATKDFGRQCLLARRFAERGVRFIQVTHSDSNVQWDQHSNLKQGHEKNAMEVDQPIAALLQDLKNRGLLEDTLVLWGGEFGRTPTVQGKNGRDHNPEGFTMWMAGGGVKPGFRYGATDEYGYYAVEDKVHIHDMHATMLHLLGLDHQRLTYRHAGRDFRLTDVAGHVARGILA